MADRVNSTLKKYPVSEESSERNFGDLQKSSVKQKRLDRTAQSILDLIISDGSISQDKMAERTGVSKRAIEMQIANLKAKGLANLKAKGLLVREGLIMVAIGAL